MGDSSSATGSTSTGSARTWKDYMSWFLYFLRIVTLVALLLTLVAYIFVIKIGLTSNHLDGLEKTMIFFSNVGFLLVVVCAGIAEIQPAWFVSRVMVMKYWGMRGFVQVWLGIQLLASVKTLSSALASEMDGDAKTLEVFCTVTGWILISIGLLLIVLSAMCLRSALDLKADRELEAALLASGGGTVVQTEVTTSKETSSSSSSRGGDNSKLKQDLDQMDNLVQNLSTAMGISYVVAKSKFGGKAGAQAAENYARELEAKQKQLTAAASRAGNAAADSIRTAAADVNSNFSPSAASSMGPGPSSSSNASASAPTIVTSSGGGGGAGGGGGGGDDDAGGGRRRRGMDDDELERMYYGK